MAVERPVASFDPRQALGAGVDGQEQDAIDKMYRPENVDAMRSAGFHGLSYRLRTELANEAWHWNPEGTWSDAAHAQGYWTSSATPGAPILTTYGYRLARRGNTIDQANNDGYSRIADGDPASFWKSNPYLDRRYTGEDNGLHPQWVVVDLGASLPVNAVRLLWGEPYATRFSIEYWDGKDPFAVNPANHNDWRPFERGAVTNGQGGDATVRIADQPRSVHFLRVLMTEGSGRSPAGSTDVRDSLGVALRELYVGTADPSGAVRDALHHGANRDRQSTMYVSSTDPWHRATDIDRNAEQPGFDRVFASGLTNGLPTTVPVAVLFGTPEDAQGELRYLAAKHYPVDRVEVGEEPDGQNVLPEDYAAAYLELVATLRDVAPGVRLGGPGFQTAADVVRVWPDAAGETSWLKRLIGYLRSHSALSALGFFSVEWYPFDDACAPVQPRLIDAPRLLEVAFRQWAADGLPPEVPKLVTEYGYSAFPTRPEVDMEGAIFNADFAAHFLALGGSASFLYGYEPNVLLKNDSCDSWGNLMLLQSGDDYRVRNRLATFYAAQLLTQMWAAPGGGAHEVYATSVDLKGGRDGLVSAYTARRPDGRWAILLLNKDSSRTWQFDFVGSGAGLPALNGPVDLYELGPDQYRWAADGAKGRPSRTRPPIHKSVNGSDPLSLPPDSISVLVAPAA